MNNDNSNSEKQHYGEDEINLRYLVKSIIEYKRFIFSFTGIVTLLGIVYVLSLPTLYVVKTSFKKPTESSVLQLNQSGILNEVAETVHGSFLTKLANKVIQKNYYIEGGYLTKLNKKNEPIVDVSSLPQFLNSISLEVGQLHSNKDLKKNQVAKVTAFEDPSTLSIVVTEDNFNIMIEFLNELISKVDNEVVFDYINLIYQKIDYRLDEIAAEREWLLTKALQDRLTQIEIIKEDDSLKIREINEQINRVRFKEKQQRLNEIILLTNAAQLAGSLGIIENNFNKIISGNNKEFPNWYLYGEKALLERVKLLENRVNDDPYIPELVELNIQLNEIQNNTLLQTLEERQDDTPFITKINIAASKMGFEGRKTNLIHELYSEKIKLESIIIELSDLSSTQVTQYATANLIASNKREVVSIVFLTGFLISIILSLLINLFKEDETKPTTK